MPKLKPEELETRRLEIVEAARACFLRSGFHRTTTDEICREANITPGGLYHYFASKDDLIAAVIEHAATIAIERLRTMTEAADDTESAYRQAVGLLYQTLLDPDIDNVTRLDLEIWAETVTNEKLAESNRGTWSLRLKWLETLVERGLADSIFDPEKVNARAMARPLLALVIGMRTGRLLRGSEFDTGGALQSLLRMQGARVDLSEIATAAG